MNHWIVRGGVTKTEAEALESIFKKYSYGELVRYSSACNEFMGGLATIGDLVVPTNAAQRSCNAEMALRKAIAA